MARSRRANTFGSMLQSVGRSLQSNPSKSRKGARRTKTRAPRGRKSTSGKGLLRRLLG